MSPLKYPTRHIFYILLQHPTELARPYVLGVQPKTSYTHALFQEYVEKAKKERDAGGSRAYISKRDIERWGCFVPVGSRVQPVEVDVYSEWLHHILESEGKDDKQLK